MDICRSYGMAGNNSCNPIIFEPMATSILLAQQKKLLELECKPDDALWQKICTEENMPTVPAKQLKYLPK